MKFTFSLILSLLFIGCSITSFPTISSSPIGDVVCSMVNCGEGSCKDSNETLVGFECECYPGWSKPKIGPITLPSCLVPNCTINLGCTGGAPSPQPFQLSLPPPPINISSPCGTIWCGDGVCLTNGTSYMCNCNEGSSNFMNSTTFPCFKPCSLGPDCYGTDLPKPPTPSISPSSPHISSPTPIIPAGSNHEDANCGVMNQNLLALLPLAALFFTWI